MQTLIKFTNKNLFSVSKMLSIITFTNKNRYPKNQSGLVTGSQLNATGQSGRQSNSAALLGLLPGGRRRGSSAEFKDPGGSGVAQQRSGISLTLFPSACARRRKPPGVSSRGHCTPPGPTPHQQQDTSLFLFLICALGWVSVHDGSRMKEC